MNIFELVKQANKNNVSIYGDLLNEKYEDPTHNLTSNEMEMYEQLKESDKRRFMMNENYNNYSSNDFNIQHNVTEISEIGKTIQMY